LSARIEKYLKRHAGILERWPVSGGTPGGLDAVIVIPALAEYPGIIDTLDDLAQCSGAERVTVVVVVNHREGAAPETIANNQDTVQHLASRADPYALIPIEAVLPAKDGVGLARKIGMDHALRMLHQAAAPESPLVCLDADTRVEEEYVQRLLECFSSRRWGVVFDYSHQRDKVFHDDLDTAIAAYELHLTYCEAGLHLIETPYAYTAMGSAMACTAEAYAACGGMRRKQAGEDFYFLQALVKTGGVERYHGVRVRPACRVSDRVPFGTGRAMQEYCDGKRLLLYHPEIYFLLRDWCRTVESKPLDAPEALLGRAVEPLAEYLIGQGFVDDWDNIREQGGTPRALRRRFHEWFDGFRLLKGIHHLRDRGYPNQEPRKAVARLLGHSIDFSDIPTAVLYRKMQAELSHRFLLPFD